MGTMVCRSSSDVSVCASEAAMMISASASQRRFSASVWPTAPPRCGLSTTFSSLWKGYCEGRVEAREGLGMGLASGVNRGKCLVNENYMATLSSDLSAIGSCV